MVRQRIEGRAPALALVNQSGQPLALLELRGKVVQTSPKHPGSVPFSMNVVVTSSAWHHQKGDIWPSVKANRLSNKEQDR